MATRQQLIDAFAHFPTTSTADTSIASTDDILVFGDGTIKTITASSLFGNIAMDVALGVDTAGYDFTLYGATTGKKCMWDTSADMLKVDAALRLHNHNIAAEGYALQIRGELTASTGTIWGIDSETHLRPTTGTTGTASVRGVQGVALLASGFTSTGGTLIGTYGQARADGTFNAAAGFMTGLYGLIEASAAITASHVCSAWLDSHQNEAVTGNHELLYMTNNGSAVMDSAIFIYGGHSITNLFTISTAPAETDTLAAEATGQTFTITKKIKINVDGATVYIPAGTVS
jgi:hypothetical protein